MKQNGTPKYRILLLGYLLLFGTYFGIRIVQLLSSEIANGEVKAIAWGKFIITSPRNNFFRSSSSKSYYQCPDIHFFYKPFGADTGHWYSVRPESLSFRDYKPGDKTGVIFPKGQPEQADIYSLEEFWFTPPYMIILLLIAGLWSIGFFVAVFKPWRMMDE